MIYGHWLNTENYYLLNKNNKNPAKNRIFLLVFMKIEILKQEHWQEVRAIFIGGILTKNATFTTVNEVLDWKNWSENYFLHSRLIAKENNTILGWAVLTPYSKKYAYRGVAEVSVYISEISKNKGIGTKLLKKLIETSEKNNIWTLQSRIYPENRASLHIHKKNNFKVIGVMKKVAQIDKIWRDVIILERRSKKVGN